MTWSLSSTCNPNDHLLQVFLFDAHNHIHMSMEGGIQPLLHNDNADKEPEQTSKNSTGLARKGEFHSHDQLIERHAQKIIHHFMAFDRVDIDTPVTTTIPIRTTSKNVLLSNTLFPFKGMALMSTQPRDYRIISKLAQLFKEQHQNLTILDSYDTKRICESKNTSHSLATTEMDIVTCYGVHPWFLHVAQSDFPVHDTSKEAEDTIQKPLQQQEQDQDLLRSRNKSSDTDTMSPLQSECPFTRLQQLQASFGWFAYLLNQLQCHPNSHVGEIGLDGARYRPSTTTTTTLPNAINQDSFNNPSSSTIHFHYRDRILLNPMKLQVDAMEIQFHLAADLQRSVSIHVVQAWGPLIDLFNQVKKDRLNMFYSSKMANINPLSCLNDTSTVKRKNKKYAKDSLTLAMPLQKVQMEDSSISDERMRSCQVEDIELKPLIFPPKVYFHAFGGRSAVVDQLDALLGRDIRVGGQIIKGSKLFFGFAPVINFRSPKTAEVVKKIGIDRLVLETDLEDYSDVLKDLHANVDFIAHVLGCDTNFVVEKTMQNAKNLYNLQ